jgi:hypothetical protein
MRSNMKISAEIAACHTAHRAATAPTTPLLSAHNAPLDIHLAHRSTHATRSTVDSTIHAGASLLHEETVEIAESTTAVHCLYRAATHSLAHCDTASTINLFSNNIHFCNDFARLSALPKSPNWMQRRHGAAAHELLAYTRASPGRITLAHRQIHLPPTSTSTPAPSPLRPLYHRPYLTLCAASVPTTTFSHSPRKLIKQIQTIARLSRLIENLPIAPMMKDAPDCCMAILEATALRTGESFFRTSFANNSLHAHRIKRLLNALPTMKRQHAWKLCYPDTSCRRCQTPVEDQEHVYACPAASQGRDSLTRTLVTERILPADASTLSMLQADPMLHRGVPSPAFVIALERDVGTARLTTTLARLSHRLNRLTYYHIWRPRCEATLAWEEANDIARHMKMHSKARPPPPTATQHQARTTRRRLTHDCYVIKGIQPSVHRMAATRC